MSKYNGNRFSVYDSQELTALGLIEELANYSYTVGEELKNKTDLLGDHKGSWQGLNKPTLSEEGMRATVEKHEKDITDINSSLEQNNGLLNDLYINVKEFGAKGDGVTNDTKALQDTFNYCIANKKRVFIPHGTYICTETLPITRGLQVKGTGINTIIRYTGLGTLLDVIEEGEGSTWDNLNIGFKIDGLYLDGTNKKGTGILLNTVYKGYINNCVVSGFNDGIVINRGWCHFITMCRIEKNFNTGIYLNSIRAGYLNAITIDKNIIEYNGVGIKIGSGVLSSTDAYYLGGNTIFISHNTIQLNEIEQIEINEFMQITINDNYLEASTSQFSKIISVGTKGLATPKQIYILRNTLSKFTDFNCIPIFIDKVDTCTIDGNTFWLSEDTDNIVINENNSTNNCYILPTNRRNLGVYPIGEANVKDIDCMTYCKRDVDISLINGWNKNTFPSIISQNMDTLQFKGQIQNNSISNNLIMTLPYRFRPIIPLRFVTFVDRENCINYDCSYVTVYIQPNGNVYVWSALTQNGSFSSNTKLVIDLNNISYSI